MSEQHNKFPFCQADDFVLEKLIYEGPHTLVFLGRQSSLNRVVIIKLLKPQIKNSGEWIKRFQREARVCARLKHPNIVDVYALGEKDGYHYITIEYIEGRSLKDLLKISGRLPADVAFSIVDQILQALGFVHQHNIIHRDVKPGNILIDHSGQAKLTDFGLAQIGEEPTVTQHGSIIGTPAYMAPEQISGSGIDRRADLFSLGAVLYEMLSGQQAFGGESYSTCLYKIMNEQPPLLTELNAGISEAISGYVEKFLRKATEERWEDALAASGQLHNLENKRYSQIDSGPVAGLMRSFKASLTSEAVGASQAGEITLSGNDDRENKPQFYHKHWLLLSGGLAAILLGVILLVWIGNSREGLLPAVPEGQLTSPATMKVLKGDSLAVSDADSNSSGRPESENFQEEIESGQSNVQTAEDSPVATVLDTFSVAKYHSNAPEAFDTIPASSSIAEIQAASRLDIHAEPWAKIIIDGSEADSQAIRQTISIDPGKHTIVFLHPNFAPKVMQVEVQPGEHKKLHWSFLKNAGYLWVEARPWAEVFIDNKLYDTTPLGQPVVLAPGNHILQLKHPQLAPHRELITILRRDTLHVRVVLKKE